MKVLQSDIPGMEEPTLPPTLTIRGDACQLLRAGTMYRPHVGQEVVLWGEPSSVFLDDWIRFQVLAQLAIKDNGGMMKLNETEELKDMFGRMWSELSEHIVSWTWADLQGKPLPPPSYIQVRGLPISEFMFMCLGFMQLAPRGSAAILSMPETKEES